MMLMIMMIDGFDIDEVCTATKPLSIAFYRPAFTSLYTVLPARQSTGSCFVNMYARTLTKPIASHPLPTIAESAAPQTMDGLSQRVAATEERISRLEAAGGARSGNKEGE